jgi:hypothetical protein
MSLQATYFDNVINYSVCFQNVSVDEFITLHDFLIDKFEKNSCDMVYSELHYNYYAAVWLKFYNEQDELRFKLLWSFV